MDCQTRAYNMLRSTQYPFLRWVRMNEVNTMNELGEVFYPIPDLPLGFLGPGLHIYLDRKVDEIVMCGTHHSHPCPLAINSPTRIIQVETRCVVFVRDAWFRLFGNCRKEITELAQLQFLGHEISQAILSTFEQEIGQRMHVHKIQHCPGITLVKCLRKRRLIAERVLTG